MGKVQKPSDPEEKYSCMHTGTTVWQINQEAHSACQKMQNASSCHSCGVLCCRSAKARSCTDLIQGSGTEDWQVAARLFPRHHCSCVMCIQTHSVAMTTVATAVRRESMPVDQWMSKMLLVPVCDLLCSTAGGYQTECTLNVWSFQNANIWSTVQCHSQQDPHYAKLKDMVWSMLAAFCMSLLTPRSGRRNLQCDQTPRPCSTAYICLSYHVHCKYISLYTIKKLFMSITKGVHLTCSHCGIR
jgi:hypothetical protein